VLHAERGSITSPVNSAQRRPLVNCADVIASEQAITAVLGAGGDVANVSDVLLPKGAVTVSKPHTGL